MAKAVRDSVYGLLVCVNGSRGGETQGDGDVIFLFMITPYIQTCWNDIDEHEFGSLHAH